MFLKCNKANISLWPWQLLFTRNPHKFCFLQPYVKLFFNFFCNTTSSRKSWHAHVIQILWKQNFGMVKPGAWLNTGTYLKPRMRNLGAFSSTNYILSGKQHGSETRLPFSLDIRKLIRFASHKCISTKSWNKFEATFKHKVCIKFASNLLFMSRPLQSFYWQFKDV